MRTLSRNRSQQAGVTVIEILVVMTIMAVSVSIFSGMVLTTARQRAINRENAVAAEGARRVLEAMRNMDFGEVYRSFNADPADDPGGPGTGPGARFAVEGLEPTAASPDGLVGEVRFPDVLVEPDPLLFVEPPPPYYALREDLDEEALGMPRDLDGDSVIDGSNHALDYLVLPVRVRLEWAGVVGEREFELHAILTDYQASE